MKTVSAAEANRSFSKLLGRVAKGEQVLVTSRGKAVMRMSPVDADEEQRRKVRKKLFARIEKRPFLNMKFDWSREDIYERDF